MYVCKRHLGSGYTNTGVIGASGGGWGGCESEEGGRGDK